MLEITSLRNGAVLNRANGTETKNGLEILLEGIADSASEVKVNGIPAFRADRKFSAPVCLTRKINEIVVSAADNFGEFQQKVVVVWDKQSFKRYNFFIDDNIFFLTDIAKSKPSSLFDHFYLKGLRETHRKYGSKFTLNLFYRNDHFPFELKDFPDRYKQEWRDNADWLRLSFHAHSEFPDRPYQHASAEKIAADFDLVKNEVIRFAGAETFIPPLVLHWGMAHPETFPVLQERGVRVLSGGFIDSKTFVGEEDKKIRTTDIGYFYEKDVVLYLESNKVFYDSRTGMFLMKSSCCCNLTPLDRISGEIDADANSKVYNETLGLLTHEQYSFDYYFNYLPDHMERIELACRKVTEAGYQPVFFADGFLGNMAWE